jgi:hypothetical protein
MQYSAVSHPVAVAGSAAFHGGSVLSMLAVHKIVVRPTFTKTLPGAAPVNPRVICIGRNSSTRRPSCRIGFYLHHTMVDAQGRPSLGI